jgi:energy-coupling factor transporter ATP-binding protein EcfA2
MTTGTSTIEGLTALERALRSTPLGLDLGTADEARRLRDELSDQIVDYLVPRLQRLDAPLLVVLGGSTGSGKSTITNTLIGREVSPAGVLRPTTRAPVLLCHPDDEGWFAGADVLPELPRVTAGGQEQSTAVTTGTVLRLVTVEDLEPGLAIIDAPDIDSVEEANRNLATQLLAAADMWLFATTAVRYADAVPWDFLRQARDRGTSLAVVINRIPAGAEDEIVPHLESMLSEAGLDEVTVFPIPQAELTDGLLPPIAVDELRRLLVGLATDAERRADVVRATLDGALDSVPARVATVIEAEREQAAALGELGTTMEQGYRRAASDLGADISSGNLLRGEVLDRWQELIGTAELMAAVQSRISLIRDRIGALLTGRTGATAEVQGEITSTLEQLLIDHADAAASSVTSAWKSLPGGRQVLDGDRSLERCSDRFKSTVAAEIRGWQDDILDLVRQRGAGKRTTARILAFGVNSIGVALMLVLFSQTGGLTGGELAIGAGTAGLSQTLLSALFGEQAVRELAADARRMLESRVGALLDGEAERFRQLLAAFDGAPDGSDTDGTGGTAPLAEALRSFERTR